MAGDPGNYGCDCNAGNDGTLSANTHTHHVKLNIPRAAPHGKQKV